MWKFDYKESWAPKNWCLNCGVREDSWVPWTARRSKQSILKEISPGVHWKDWCWSWNCNTLATWCEELTHWRRPWCWEKLRAGREGDDRGWDSWMASPTQWTWVWASSGRWWRTRKPGMLPWGYKESDTTEQLNNMGMIYPHSKRWLYEALAKKFKF